MFQFAPHLEGGQRALPPGAPPMGVLTRGLLAQELVCHVTVRVLLHAVLVPLEALDQGHLRR